jgi:hypothetical protein
LYPAKILLRQIVSLLPAAATQRPRLGLGPSLRLPRAEYCQSPVVISGVPVSMRSRERPTAPNAGRRYLDTLGPTWSTETMTVRPPMVATVATRDVERVAAAYRANLFT